MELISKKELLATTGISYGQLYRWKREGLIPEAWFIKQSAFTGQETFFPRDEILARVRSILDMKDTHSLEELAGLLSADETTSVSAGVLRTLEDPDGGIAAALGILQDALAKDEYFLGEVALAWGIAKANPDASSGAALLRQGALMLPDFGMADTLCSVLEVGGSFHVCLSRGTEEPVFDPAIRVLARLPLGETVNVLKSRLADKGEK